MKFIAFCSLLTIVALSSPTPLAASAFNDYSVNNYLEEKKSPSKGNQHGGKDSKQHGHGKNKDKNQHQSRSPSTESLISIDHRLTVTTARDLASRYQLQSGRALPPGIRKQLARGKPLPPGIAKRISNPDFIAALPQYPDHEWQMCGTDLVLVAVATAVIVDVLFDVF